MISRKFTFFLFLSLVFMTGCRHRSAPLDALPDHLREGYIVWESNRTGAWRIFKKDLSGGKVRQISPEESGRSHFAAHISPNGKYVIYLSYPQDRDGYRRHPPDITIPMWILEIDKRNSARVLIENARTYGEHRSVVWLSDTELVYIDATYQTRLLDLETGEHRDLIQGRPAGHLWDHGYLPDPTLRYATSGVPNFGLLEGDSNRFNSRTLYDGCQPFFTRDGEWGYWMAGMGGPFNRFNPVTEEVSTLLRRHDPRMPANRGYLYFPHISACNQLLVIAASPDQHDHNTSDYDLFVAPLNPATLELVADPIRFTTHEATDRFPEIFLPPLDLGRHEGKAPFTLLLEEGLYRLNGKRVTMAHEGLRIEQPGTYVLEREARGRQLRGIVNVLHATPPRLISSGLNRNGEITLSFDESVDPVKARFSPGDSSLEFDVGHEWGSRRILLVPKTDERPEYVVLTFAGVLDAKQKNATPEQTIRLEHTTWPVTRDGLVLAWENGTGVKEIIEGSRVTPVNLRAQGRARKTVHQSLRLDEGSFVVSNAGEVLAGAFDKHDEFTLEAVVQARRPDQRGPARIVSLSEGITARNFTLGQENDQYVFRLRTADNAPNAVEPQAVLGPVSTAEPVHLLITYRAGELTAYLNGTETLRSVGFADSLGDWGVHTLILGAETDGSRDWAGTLEAVALYRRALTADEIAGAAERAKTRLETRIPVPRTIVEARLLAATPVPTLEEITPYREILVVYEYEVLQTLAGPEVPAGHIRVYHWGILDGQAQTLPAQQPGETARLWLEPYEAHTHLQDRYPADTLDLNLDLPLFLDVGL